MASKRYQFGGDIASWIVFPLDASAVFGGGQELPAIPTTDQTVNFYDQPNGTLLGDFLDAGGSPLSSIVVPAGSAYLPFFQGPISLTSLWFQDSNDVWHVLQGNDLSDRLDGAEQDVLALYGLVGAVSGGGSVIPRDVYQLVAGPTGWPARIDSDGTRRVNWFGPDQPPVGVDGSGFQGMMPRDLWYRTTAVLSVT